MSEREEERVGGGLFILVKAPRLVGKEKPTIFRGQAR